MKQKYFSAVILACLLILSFTVSIILPSDYASAYTPHASIYIDGNSDFSAANGITGGNGTIVAPYIIECIEVNSTLFTGIEIRNTTAHFEIRNVSIHTGYSGHFGILLFNVTNGRISDSTIFNNTIGIYLEKSSNITIRNNTITQNVEGVRLYNSDHNLIVYNELHQNNNSGLLIRHGAYNNCSSNNITSHSQYGVRLYEDSSYNTFLGNDLQNNGFGFLLSNSVNNIMRNNTIYQCLTGMELDYSSCGNRLLKNGIELCDIAIYLRYQSDGNLIDGNIIPYNNDGIRIATSIDNMVSNNIITRNDLGIELSKLTVNNTITNNDIYGNNINGIHLLSATYCNVTKNHIYDNNRGIFLETAANDNLILNNNISRNDLGIYFLGSSALKPFHNRIESNNISWNDWYGIYIGYGDTTTIINNTVCSNIGNFRFENSDSNFIIGNNISYSEMDGLKIFYCEGTVIQNNQMYFNNGNNMDFLGSINNKIENNHIIGSLYNGIYFRSDCRDTIIQNNTIMADNDGIASFQTENNIISNNTIIYSEQGLSLYSTVMSRIENNTLMHNSRCGLMLSEADRTYIKNNKMLFNNDTGMTIYYLTNGEISNNLVTDNEDSGIYLRNSEQIAIIANDIARNGYGLYLRNTHNDEIKSNFIHDNVDGLLISSSNNNMMIYNRVENSTDEMSVSGYWNTIFNNNFINVSGRPGTSGSENSWNLSYPIGGNYWSDYNGIDNKQGSDQDQNGPDGIGDIAYNIASYINDYYPLMVPFDERNKPSAPQNLKALADENSITLTWEPPVLSGSSSIIGYSIFRGTATEGEIFYKDTGNLLSYRDTDLILGEYIYYKICARNTETSGYLSTEVRTAIPTLPDAPENVKIKPGVGQLNISWSPPFFDGGIEITNYRIYRGSSVEDMTMLKELGNVYFYADNALNEGELYCYYVRAQNSKGEGAKSPVIWAKVPQKPSEPKYLIAETGASFIHLKWTQPDDDGGLPVINFNIYRGNESGSKALISQIGNLTFFNDSTVEKGRLYYYSVSARTAVGEGKSSDTVRVKIITVPGKPVDIVIRSGDGFVQLQWKMPELDGGLPVLKYCVYRGINQSAIHSLNEVNNDTFYYNDTSVENDRIYYYKISARSDFGEGEMSAALLGVPYEPKNEPPFVSFLTDLTSGPAPFTVKFNGICHDIDGSIVEYYWDFDDGNYSTGMNASHTFYQAGVYNVRLTVVDDDGQPAVSIMTIIVSKALETAKPGTGDEKIVENTGPWVAASWITSVFGVFLILFLIIKLRVFRKRKPVIVQKGPVKFYKITRIKKNLREIEKPEIIDAELATELPPTTVPKPARFSEKEEVKQLAGVPGDDNSG